MFLIRLTSIHLTLSGFRSLPSTLQPFLAAGTANGPTPAMTSTMTSSGSREAMMRSCSECRREFQYTSEKSNVKVQLDSDCRDQLGLHALGLRVF